MNSKQGPKMNKKKVNKFPNKELILISPFQALHFKYFHIEKLKEKTKNTTIEPSNTITEVQLIIWYLLQMFQ